MTMTRVLNKLVITSVLLLPPVLIGVIPAYADEVTLWDYSIHSSFSAFDPSWAVPGMPNAYMANEPTHLSWGSSTGSGPSELSVTDSAHSASFVETDGAAVSGPTLTALNRQITDPSHQSLTEATWHVQSFLNPAAPAGHSLPVPLQQDFWINFHETALKDALVLSNSAALNYEFIFDGTIYDVHLLLNGLATLSDSLCAQAGASAGCQGLIVPTNGPGTLTTAFSITDPPANPIPEPSTILLLAAGLAGLLVYRTMHPGVVANAMRRESLGFIPGRW
jgi:hypothetical protein